MSDHDTMSPARRRFLVQGAAAAMGAVAGPAGAEERTPPGIPDWMQAPGAVVGSQTYGARPRASRWR